MYAMGVFKGKMENAVAGVEGGFRGGAAVWLAILAVLTLLLSPVLAGRAHAAMLAPASSPMAMAGMTHAGKTTASARCHHDDGAACSIACALASQLLPPSPSDALPLLGEAGSVTYASLNVSPAGAASKRSTPPPR